MIFKNKKIKLPNGENLTMFPQDENVMHLYLKNEGVVKKKIILGNIVRCENLSGKWQGDALFELSKNHLCVCLGGSISIIENEK